jgi:hypothetical protein
MKCCVPPIFSIAILLFAFTPSAGLSQKSSKSTQNVGSWSKSINGLQARIDLSETPKYNGTRQLVPYLELRNVDDSAYQLKVRCGGGRHVKFELVDAEGTPIRRGDIQTHAGFYADPGTVVLPLDSSIRISMRSTGWGVPKDAPAMISTDSGAWILKSEEKGNVFLRVKVKGEAVKSDDRLWHGSIEAFVKVDWSESPVFKNGSR